MIADRDSVHSDSTLIGGLRWNNGAAQATDTGIFQTDVSSHGYCVFSKIEWMAIR